MPWGELETSRHMSPARSRTRSSNSSFSCLKPSDFAVKTVEGRISTLDCLRRAENFKSVWLVFKSKEKNQSHRNQEQSSQNDEWYKEFVLADFGGLYLRRHGHGNCHRLHLRHHRLWRHSEWGRHDRLLKLRGRYLVRLRLRHHRWLNVGHAGSHGRRNRRRRDYRHGTPCGRLWCCRRWRLRSTLRRRTCTSTGKLKHAHELIRLGRFRGSRWSLHNRW